MEPDFLRARKDLSLQWEQLFSRPKKFQFRVRLFDIGFCFHTDNVSLFNDLKQFFPEDWMSPEGELIDIYWSAPCLAPWDHIPDPNCFFWSNFISQRDFLTYKRNEKCYELMAFEKLDDGLFNFLRFLLPQHLLNHGRILFHSSCVIHQGKAYLYFGPSGAGKSTIASLCQGGQVMGDDMNILTFFENEVRVEGAPLGQRIFDRSLMGRSFPIEKAFWLVQDHENRHQPIQTGAIKFYLSSFANLFWDQLDSQQYGQVFKFVEQLKNQVPLFQLNFKKNTEVWNYVKAIGSNI